MSTYRRKNDTRLRKKPAAKKAAKKKAGLAPIPQKSLMAKASMGKSVGFPKTKSVVMKYVDVVNVNTVVGALGKQKFVANGIFDPNFTGGGHQPYTHDQWNLFYNHYRVTKSRIKVTTVGNGVLPMIIGIYLSDDTVALSGIEELLESGRGPYQILPSDASSTRTLYADFDNSFFGPDVDPGATTGAMNSTNPTENAIFNVYAKTLNSTAESPTTTFLIEIDYHVTLMEPKDLTGS